MRRPSDPRLTAALDEVARIDDPVDRHDAVHELLAGLAEVQRQAREARTGAVRQLLAEPGGSFRSVAGKVGLSQRKVRDLAAQES